MNELNIIVHVMLILIRIQRNSFDLELKLTLSRHSDF